jgi:hypothetical protein
MEIIDNFLDKKDFLIIQNAILNGPISWYFQKGKDRDYGDDDDNELDQYQFTHLFYNNFEPCSSFFKILEPLVKKLNVSSLIRIKANLNPHNTTLSQGIFHTDYNRKNQKTAVFYINDCNGYTLFKKPNKKVYSKANRVVIFDSNTLHSGTNTTDKKRRVVLNINYYEL